MNETTPPPSLSLGIPGSAFEPSRDAGADSGGTPRLSERRARAHFLATPVPIYAWRLAGDDFVLMDYNTAAARLTTRIHDFLDARARDAFRESPEFPDLMRQCLAREERLDLAVRHRLLTMPDARDLAVAFVPIRPDVVLMHVLVTDAVMPHGTGADVIVAVRAVRPRCRAVLMSGYTGDEITRRGISMAEFSFLQKPFSAAAIARHVRQVLDG